MKYDINDITWDPQKNIENTKKHKISFYEAQQIFNDVDCITDDDDLNSIYEDRFKTIGKINQGTIIMVAYTIVQNTGFSNHSEIIRIISARKATPSERKRYESQRIYQ